MLKEQMKSIKRELGIEKDDKEALLVKYRERLDEIKTHLDSDHQTLTAIDNELSKLGSLEKNSAEFNVTRSYLDWLTSLPW